MTAKNLPIVAANGKKVIAVCGDDGSPNKVVNGAVGVGGQSVGGGVHRNNLTRVGWVGQ